jgi:hypothetical protein
MEQTRSAKALAERCDPSRSSQSALIAVVLSHLAVNIVHGRAHAGASVPLPLSSALFVYIVILAAPLAGLVLSFWRARAGAWVVAASMGGALVFGLINHFIVAGPDHVAHVAAEWRTLFGATAALLAVTEAAGVAIGVWCAMPRVAPGRAA